MQSGWNWVLRGPNRWAPFLVIEAEVDLGADAGLRPGQDPTFAAQLKKWFGVWEAERIGPEANLADALLQLTLEFQSLAGCDKRFGQVHATPRRRFSRRFRLRRRSGRASIHPGGARALPGTHLETAVRRDQKNQGAA